MHAGHRTILHFWNNQDVHRCLQVGSHLSRMCELMSLTDSVMGTRPSCLWWCQPMVSADVLTIFVIPLEYTSCFISMPKHLMLYFHGKDWPSSSLSSVGADGVGACWGNLTCWKQDKGQSGQSLKSTRLYPSPPEGSHLERQAPGHPRWDGLALLINPLPLILNPGPPLK